MLLNCGVGEDSWESLGLQGDPISPSWRKSVLKIHWKDWCWKWNSSTLATWCEEVTHLKRPWFWERLRAGGEGDDRGWDGWMASPTQWTWAWVNSGSWWWTGRPDMLWFMGLQRVGHHWATELNWITFQYCSGFVRTLTWISCGCTCVPHPDPPSISLPIPSLRVVLVHWLCVPYYMHWTSTGDWSISHIVTYMFQCYSLKSSQPCPLPQSPKVCSLYCRGPAPADPGYSKERRLGEGQGTTA